jgi:hypothetical protein
MSKRRSLRFRLTAWCDWLLVVLALTFGAYSYACLKCCLSLGVQDALSLRAKLISSAILSTGHLPPPRMPLTHGLRALFLSVHRNDGAVPAVPQKSQREGLALATARQPWKAPALSARKGEVLIATTPMTLGGQRYVVEVAAPTHPLKVLLHEALTMLLLSLLTALGLATLGSWFFISRALVPIHSLALMAQALPLTAARPRPTSATVQDDIGRLCITINDTLGQWQESFERGPSLYAACDQAQCMRLATMRDELAILLAQLRLPMGLTESVMDLLKESERLTTLACKLSTPLPEDSWQTRSRWFRLHLGALAAASADHICVLSETLGADCLRHSPHIWDPARSCHW